MSKVYSTRIKHKNELKDGQKQLTVENVEKAISEAFPNDSHAQSKAMLEALEMWVEGRTAYRRKKTLTKVQKNLFKLKESLILLEKHILTRKQLEHLILDSIGLGTPASFNQYIDLMLKKRLINLSPTKEDYYLNRAYIEHLDPDMKMTEKIC